MKLKWTQNWVLANGKTIDATTFQRFNYRIDGGASSNTGLPFRADGKYEWDIDALVAPLPDGDHTFEIRLVLANGNRSPWTAVTVTLDRTNPVAPAGLVVV